MARHVVIENIQIPYAQDCAEAVLESVRIKLGINVQSDDISIWRKSLDVRAKRNIHYNYSVLLKDESAHFAQFRTIELELSKIPCGNISSDNLRPVVIGFGPAGIFAAYYLAKAGLRPIILERGGSVSERVGKVESFWNGCGLDSECNVQFGEGGAGTFSDGKLTARSKDPASRWIREILVEHGASPRIRFEAKAHIGTDKLREIIPRIRATVEGLGGTVRFNSLVSDLVQRSDKLCAIKLSDGTCIETSTLILAIGHSARDTFSMLQDKGVLLQPKPFAVGFRVEHSQDFINTSTYGPKADLSKLPPAEYVLAHQVEDRGVYSFCMCPGGVVVNASSDPEGLVVNGMSCSGRNSRWANSALAVSVSVNDYFVSGPLDGVLFQRDIERRAKEMALQNRAPASDLKSFLASEKPARLAESSFSNGLECAKVGELFPGFVSNAIIQGVRAFEQTLPGFISQNPLLIAPETRTSSPVRIVRNAESGESVSLRGVFPVGEGAGYAGGIISAAIDGWRAAEKIVANRFQ